MRSAALPFAVLLSLVVSVPSSAQSLPTWAAPADPYATGTAPVPSAMAAPPNVPSAPAQVPLDGGLGALVLAGAAYAARRLRAR